MAVKREDVARYVAELGLPQEQTDSLITTIMSNEQSAVQFVGQRLRHDDFTRKTQELGSQRQGLEQRANEQIQAYASQLQTAQDRIEKIMEDLGKAKINETTANARLLKVKEKFNLSDEDIPALEVHNPAGTAMPTSQSAAPDINIDKKLETFKRDLFKELMPEMMAVMNFVPKYADVAEQHKSLTGKSLTRKDFEEITTHAKDKRVTFEQAWEEKYGIPEVRASKRDEENKRKWREEWETEQKRRASEDALAGVRRTDPGRESLASPVLRKQFQQQSEPPAQTQPPAQQQAQPTAQQQQAGPRLSGAERAAAKFMERRSQGIPMGAQQQP